jgi:hypothetical protein
MEVINNMEDKTPLIKISGYGVNIKYTTYWDRVATFTDERDAFAFYYLLSKSTEAHMRNANIEIEKIYALTTGDYEYETIIRLREEEEDEN